ncbi:LysR family transcriptional regulator [Afifella pfennigii]|uniref:LysR family transcriptional regulator n=1 Tax=Afifella pfennigii TaxID=209897 RepID=UPI00047D10DC|nr:LysR family transcriptional regulator [Afifella pfennigii]
MFYLEKLSFRHLVTLRVLYRTRSMSATAMEVGRTQPAISQQIAAVEDAVGFAVLYHRRGSIHFTARGERLVGEATRLLEDFQASVAEIRRISGEPIRIGMPEDVRLALASSLASLKAGNVEIVSMTSLDVIRSFHAGDLHLGLAETAEPLADSMRTWRFGLSWAGCRPHIPGPQDIRVVSFPHGCFYTGLAAEALCRAEHRMTRHLTFFSLGEIFRELANGGVTIVSAHLSNSLGSWHGDIDLPPLPSSNLNLLASSADDDHLSWASTTLAGGLTRALSRNAQSPIAEMLKSLDIDLRVYGHAGRGASGDSGPYAGVPPQAPPDRRLM